jgi:hypothetical protein
MLQFILTVLAILLFVGTAAWAGISAAPYVPSRTRDVARIIALAEIQPGERIVDCGSGDGRVVLAAAAAGATAIGYEISFLPWLISVIRGWMSPYRSRVRFYWKSFYSADLSDMDVVFAFLLPSGLQKLGKQLDQQKKSGRRILSFAWEIKNWTPELQDKPDPSVLALWRYRQV